MPGTHCTRHYCRTRIQDPKKFARGSFRTKVVSSKTKIIVACPRGKWKRGRCSVAMKLQAKLKKR